MERIYSSPWRVYFVVLIFCLIGIGAGMSLPISLFPNSSKSRVGINIGTSTMTGKEFLQNYGTLLEGQLLAMSGKTFEVESVESTYRAQSVDYKVDFKWGNDPMDSFRETERLVNAFSARLPSQIRDSVSVWQERENSGFFALSFYSEKRSPNEVYDILEPLLMNRLSGIKDAETPQLYNPASEEIHIELKPEALASLRLLPSDVMAQLRMSLQSYAVGSVKLGSKNLSVQFPKAIQRVEDLSAIQIARGVPLSRIAHIDVGPDLSSSMVFKTSGFSSLILFATPKPNGNVKKMSEDIVAQVMEIQPLIPKDIHFKILVDPSQFIRDAISNVMHEVGIAAMLAVFVLLLFIGSFKNVATAAIEIPLSMVFAFILMKLFGVNLNLISLGGLALSAGMNVDASVVVMENIFRHLEEAKAKLNFSERLRIICQAVQEIRAPLLSSTAVSLVVFLPLMFTSELTHSILGDLAKAIVFSHGCSVFVALFLVPTIRLQLMATTPAHDSASFRETTIQKMEATYLRLLTKALNLPGLQKTAGFGILIVLVVSSILVLVPRLKKEIIGKLDTDWIYMGLKSDGNDGVRQMVSASDEIEAQLLKQFGEKIDYTFNQINGNRSTILARLKDKREMMSAWKAIEKAFPNTPFIKFEVFPWNPAEFDIPDPPQLLVSLRGGTREARLEMARSLKDTLEEQKLFSRISASSNLERNQTLLMTPNLPLLQNLQSRGFTADLGSLSNYVYAATTSQTVDQLPLKGRSVPIILQFPKDFAQTPEDLGALAVSADNKILPLKALLAMTTVDSEPDIVRKDQREFLELRGRLNQDDLPKKDKLVAQAKEHISKWIQSGSQIDASKEKTSLESENSSVSLRFEDSEKDLNTALRQLSTAVLVSIALVFLILVFQFGSAVSAFLVLTAIPLGFLGATISLFAFSSTLSLNSALGVILLNGIAVANSILLVDFTERLVKLGRSPREAALEAAHKRLRPILITSLTTVLGMLPIALGLGEGGRVLQPLGVAVSGGLWVSMLLTIFAVPVLQVAYLERRKTT